MNKLFVIAFLLVSVISFGQEEAPQLTWLTNLEEAQKISKVEDKPILLYFTGSDWCAPCKGLKKDFFESAEFANRAKNLVLVMIDYPRRLDIITEEQRAYNKEIISKYNLDKSFPKLIMLNHKGKEMGELSGYSSYSTYRDASHHFNFVDKYISSNK